MKRAYEDLKVRELIDFSTLDSGLRDETSWLLGKAEDVVEAFQYPQPRVYAMKPGAHHGDRGRWRISVPSTSGLRDETVCRGAVRSALRG